MFREIRYKKKELLTEDTIKLFKECEYGILSTNSENSYAYGVPVNFVYLANAIYFHCAKNGHKLDNINLNNKVSFCVVGKANIVSDKFTTDYESGMIFGRAEEIFECEKETALVELIRKYCPEHFTEGMEYVKKASDNTTVIKINIEHMSGKGTK